MVIAVPAGIALSAYHLRLDGHFVPFFKVGHIRRNLCYFTRDLMTLNDRIAGKRMLSVIYVDIGATYAYPYHPY